MSNRHTGTGRFVSGKSTGVYRGAAKHDPSTEEIKTALHTKPSRTVVAPHANTASVSTDGGAKPHAHDCEGDCNVAANAKTNAAMSASGSPRLTSDPGQLAGAGVFKSN
jgi:hypothetical protein